MQNALLLQVYCMLAYINSLSLIIDVFNENHLV